MFRFPYFSFPYNYSYYKRPSNHLSNLNPNLYTNKNSIIDNNNKINNTIKNTSQKNNYYSDEDKPIFEILGIKLFLDDIIILCVLFFLYQEKVKDEMLYIILLLLLFS